MYDKITCRIRDRIEVSKHYSGRYGAPGMKREPKKKATPEEVERHNHWKRCRDLRRIIELNFEGGDWHVTLTCEKDKRPTKEEAPKVIRKFLAKLRQEYKKQGWELKYVISCEIGDRGAVHWHMVCNNEHNEMTDSAKLIRENWPRGRPYFSNMDATGEYERLAKYMVKQASKRIERGETVEKMSYSRSRNLKKPVERRERIRANAWRKDPKIPEGWELVEDSLVNGISEVTGLPWQQYVIRRTEEKGGRSQPLSCVGRKGTAPPGGQGNVSAGVPDEQGDADKKQKDRA